MGTPLDQLGSHWREARHWCELSLSFISTDSALALYKTLGPVGTGASAIIGLLARFRTDDGKRLTRVGIASIAGIIFSSGLGSLAANIENSRARSADLVQQAQYANAISTIQLLNRSMSPIRHPTATFDISIDYKDLAKLKKDIGHSDEDSEIHNFSVVLGKDGKIDYSKQGIFLSINFVPSSTPEPASILGDPNEPWRNPVQAWTAAQTTKNLEVHGSLQRYTDDGPLPEYFVDAVATAKDMNLVYDGMKSWLEMPSMKFFVLCRSKGQFCAVADLRNVTLTDDGGQRVKSSCNLSLRDKWNYTLFECQIDQHDKERLSEKISVH